MNTLYYRLCRAGTTCLALALGSSIGVAANKNPTSKLYVADLEGQAEIDTGERIEDLDEKSVHNAQGTVIETKEDGTNAMVFSNGTGIYFHNDTRVEVKKFVQEPFSPNRSDLEAEPSLSQTHGFVPRGTIGLCTPRMVAGSTMVYSTPHGSVSIRGQKVVIESDDFETRISLIAGDVTVRGGETDGGGQTLQGGQQAVIRQLPGQPTQIFVQQIPDEQMDFVEDKVTMACNARKTVYFDVAEKQNNDLASGQPGIDGDPTSSTVIDEDTGTDVGTGEGFLSIFDDETNATGGGDTVDVLIPVEVTPVETPVDVTASASSITS